MRSRTAQEGASSPLGVAWIEREQADNPQEGNDWGSIPLSFFAPHHGYATTPGACACSTGGGSRATSKG